MRLYRTRSIIVQTVQVTGFNWPDLEAFCGPQNVRRRPLRRGLGANTEPDGTIGDTYSASHNTWLPFRVGDWIESGPHGDLTPVRAEHRAARYQPLHG